MPLSHKTLMDEEPGQQLLYVASIPSQLLMLLRERSHLAHLHHTMQKYNCYSSPVPCLPAHCSSQNQAWAQLPPVHKSSGHSAATAQWSKKTENILDMDFLWLISCCFSHKWPSHIPGIAMQRNMVILHVHVVQSCMSNQAKEACLSMVQSTHTSQTNWTLEVEHACSWGWPALGTFTHVPCSLHFFMMDSTELQGCSGSLFLYLSPDLYLLIIFWCSCLECVLVFIV